jgi:photosystem II stability/assembly factor-like uncharacterized protein
MARRSVSARRASAALAIAALGVTALGLASPDALAQSPTTQARAAQPRAAQPRAASAPDAALYGALRYRMVGPARGGRVTTATGVAQQPHTFYMGSTGGGVWKTTDAGRSWFNISDGFIGASSMGAIDVADSDPNVIYVGSGSDGLRSNVSPGDGVYRSTDAGKTWTHVGLRDAGQIGAVAVHPTNPRTAYVAVIGNAFAPSRERGVYRTTDGGSSWTKVLHVSDSTGATDVEINPANPRELYASMWRAERKPWTIISGAREGGVYKSTDGGDTWTKLGGGLPTGLFGKSNVAISAANPRRVYALVEAAPGNGLYRSDDAGATWALVSAQPTLITRPFYYTNITADPTNADVVFVGAEGFWKSVDGGRTFRGMDTPHGDNHDLWINPTNPAIWIQANDGGVNVTLDSGRTWSSQYNQPTAEIYQVYVDSQFPYRLYGAQQDNSTLIVPSLPLSASAPDDPIQSWRQGPGCETGPIIPHPTNPDTVYGSCKGLFSRMSLRTGQEKSYAVGAQSLYGNAGKDLVYRFQRVSPMEVSPHDGGRTLYYGSQYVHRTRDEGVTWERISPDLTANDPRYQSEVSGGPITIDVTGEEYYSTLYAIRESPVARGVIWTGANDGPVHVTRDGGKTWTNVTPKDLPPGGRVQNIEPSPRRAGTAYIAVLRYLLGDFKPYIYKTDDYGRSWTLLTTGSNGIPAHHPTRVVREDPDRAGLLYAGTEYGMFVSFDDGRQWQPFQLNLPVTPITDMKVHRKDLVLSTQGRSFWVLDNLTPVHQAADRVAQARAHLYAPRTAYRFRYPSGFGGAESSRSGSDAPEYVPAGAMIDYTLADSATRVTLDVLDATGTVVRTFTSDAAGERRQPPEEPGMRAPSMETVGTPRLPTRVGHNRFTWDLAMAGPWDASPQRSGRNGPTVVPGTYTLRLSAGDQRVTQPLVVRADPRVAADGVTLAVMREQLAHNLRVRDLVTESNMLVARVRAEKQRLTAAGASSADTLQRLTALEAKLLTPSVRYSRPGLQAHIGYLYGMSNRADQKVGRDAVERYRVLRQELDARAAELRAITTATSAMQ